MRPQKMIQILVMPIALHRSKYALQIMARISSSGFTRNQRRIIKSSFHELSYDSGLICIIGLVFHALAQIKWHYHVRSSNNAKLYGKMCVHNKSNLLRLKLSSDILCAVSELDATHYRRIRLNNCCNAASDMSNVECRPPCHSLLRWLFGQNSRIHAKKFKKVCEICWIQAKVFTKQLE